jgi:hypothetical protein
MSRPESVSSSTATRGLRSAICKISLRFFSPPLNPWLRWRLANDLSMPSRSIHSVMSTRTSSAETSSSVRAAMAWRRNWVTETPSIDSGYWKARNRPALDRTSVGQAVTSSPSSRIEPDVTV